MQTNTLEDYDTILILWNDNKFSIPIIKNEPLKYQSAELKEYLRVA